MKTETVTRKKKPYTTATYSEGNEDLCDLEELARTYRSVGNIPLRVGWLKACEIALLADAFLILNARYAKERK